jgi:hypothetical protein
MSDKTKHDVHYVNSGDPRASGIPTTGVPKSPTSKDAGPTRHPNSGKFTGKGK